MLGPRIVTAVVLAAVFLAALFFAPRPAWVVLMAAALALAAWEWARICAFSAIMGAVFALLALIVFAAFAWYTPRAWTMPAYVLAMLFWFLLAPVWLRKRPRTVPRPVLAAVGAIIIVAAFVALIELRDESPALVLAVMAVIWISDTAAFFTGRRFGRHKLAPNVSPGKTWEGVWGALAAAGIYGLCWHWFPQPALPQGASPGAMALALLALAFAVLGIIGDLFESQMKRNAGVKDSGRLLPGHGGALDRIDALLPVLPAAAWLFAT
jgi:phosphatidate cytidylyltransferase